MKVFDKKGFVEFVRNDEELFLSNVGVDSKENEFRYMRDDVGNDYLDLGFEEECIRMYFIIRGV